MDITVSLNSEQTHATGTFISSKGVEVYFEVPAIFNDGILDETATQEKINNLVQYVYKMEHSSGIGNTSGTQG